MTCHKSPPCSLSRVVLLLLRSTSPTCRSHPEVVLHWRPDLLVLVLADVVLLLLLCATPALCSPGPNGQACERKQHTHTTSRNDHSKNFQQFLREDTTQLHFDIAAATQQQRNKKTEDTITHYIMYSNFKSYHHLLIDSGACTHVCPKDYAPEKSVPQLYTVTNKKITSGSYFNPRHCTITHGSQQTSSDTLDSSTYEHPVCGIKYVPYKQSTSLQDLTSTQ